VEKNFAWFENFRGLLIDYVYFMETVLAMAQLFFSKIMLNKYLE